MTENQEILFEELEVPEVELTSGPHCDCGEGATP